MIIFHFYLLDRYKLPNNIRVKRVCTLWHSIRPTAPVPSVVRKITVHRRVGNFLITRSPLGKNNI